MKRSNSNECLSLYYIIPFPVLRGYLKSGILHTILELTSVKRAWCEPYGWHRCSSNLPYASNEDYETLQQQWVSIYAVQYHISHAERVAQSWRFV